MHQQSNLESSILLNGTDLVPVVRLEIIHKTPLYAKTNRAKTWGNSRLVLH